MLVSLAGAWEVTDVGRRQKQVRRQRTQREQARWDRQHGIDPEQPVPAITAHAEPAQQPAPGGHHVVHAGLASSIGGTGRDGGGTSE